MVLTGCKTSLIHRTKPEKLLRIAQFRGGLIVIFNLEKNETLLFEYFLAKCQHLHSASGTESILSIRWSMDYHRHSANSANHNLSTLILRPIQQLYNHRASYSLKRPMWNSTHYCWFLLNHTEMTYFQKMEFVCTKLFPVNAITHPLPNNFHQNEIYPCKAAENYTYYPRGIML